MLCRLHGIVDRDFDDDCKPLQFSRYSKNRKEFYFFCCLLKLFYAIFFKKKLTNEGSVQIPIYCLVRCKQKRPSALSATPDGLLIADPRQQTLQLLSRIYARTHTHARACVYRDTDWEAVEREADQHVLSSCVSPFPRP